jgi:hypothetical protein
MVGTWAHGVNTPGNVGKREIHTLADSGVEIPSLLRRNFKLSNLSKNYLKMA